MRVFKLFLSDYLSSIYSLVYLLFDNLPFLDIIEKRDGGCRMLKNIWVLLMLTVLSSCVSYYDGYENDYFASSYGSYYNSPLRVRGLSYNDFYMLDNYPHDYFNMQIWSAVSDISRFSIVSIARGLRQ